MPVCRFYQQGRCRFGADCKNEHPGFDQPQGFSRPSNAFEVLNRDSPGHGRGFSDQNNSNSGKFGDVVPPNKYKLDADQMRKDLIDERPVWPFSCYAPNSSTPLQLFGGEPREYSPEELRLRYYQLASEGKAIEAKGEEDSLRASAEQQTLAAVNDLRGAIRYIQEGENKHPNRIDVIEGRAPNEQGQGFGSNEARQNGTFGRLNVTPNAGNIFAASKPAQPAFGTSGFGTNPNASPFAAGLQQQQPPRLPGPFNRGGPPPNPFSQAANNASPANQNSSPFGKPALNPFAAAAAAASGPGTAAQHTFNHYANMSANPFGGGGGAGAGGNTFASAGSQGASGAPANPFAIASQKAGSQGAAPASPFAMPNNNPNASAAPNAAGGPPNPFATAPKNAGPQVAPPANPFATLNNNSNTSPSNAAGASASPFARAAQNTASQGAPANPFATGNNNSNAPPASNPFARNPNGLGVEAKVQPGQPSAPGTGSGPAGFGGSAGISAAVPAPNMQPGTDMSLFNHQILNNQDVRQGTNERLTSFRGQRVQYGTIEVGDDLVATRSVSIPYYQVPGGEKVRIWLEKPKQFLRPAADPPKEVYTPELVGQLEFMVKNGRFKDDIMPEYPLPRADTTFDI